MPCNHQEETYEVGDFDCVMWGCWRDRWRKWRTPCTDSLKCYEEAEAKEVNDAV